MARRFDFDNLLDVSFPSPLETSANLAIDLPVIDWQNFAIEALVFIDQPLIENKAGKPQDPISAADTNSIAVFQLSSLLPINGGDGTNGFVIRGIDKGDLSGASVSSAGDINGDGFDDIIIGAYRADSNGNTAGESYLIFGSDSGFRARQLSTLNGDNGFVINGVDGGDFSGISVSSAGDLNGDGFDDLIIGAILADPNGNGSAGESYVIYGTDARFSASLELSTLNGTNGFVINGIGNDDNSGSSVSSAGDINGDGFDDIIIGAPKADPNGRNSGESYVVFGSDTNFGASFDLSTLNGTNGFVLNGINLGDQSGQVVSSAGDVNGDGFADIIIGADEASPNGNSLAGESYVVFGSGTGFSSNFELSALNGNNGFIISGISAVDGNGKSVASAGDINGDGFDDILVSSFRADSNGKTYIGFGETYVIFGTNQDFSTSFDLTTLNGSNGFAIKGAGPFDQSGNSVSSAGDINGDGFDDILIGASKALKDGRVYSGESYVVFGSETGFAASLDLSTLDGSNGFVIKSSNFQDRTGASVSSAGDVNGDGFDDILIGAPFARAQRGDSYVIYGRAEFNPATVTLSSIDDVYKVTDTGEVVFGLAGNDRLTGGKESDYLSGDSGNDTLRGNQGNDILDGGMGDDALRGDHGNDVINGGLGEDTLAGNQGEDSLSGGRGDDVIFGGNQADELFGEDGADSLNGGRGHDMLDGGAGNDMLSGLHGQDTLLGGDGDDVLFGNSGGDKLFGGDGHDTLNGGGSNDTLTGGAGADIFVLSTGFKTDRVMDFEDGVDLIDFSGNGAANSFADVMAAAFQAGVNVRIELNLNNILILENLDLADLDASDFIF